MSDTPLRPLLPPQRKTSTLIAEYLGTLLIPVCFLGLLLAIRSAFRVGDWQCSGDAGACFQEFDQLTGWDFFIPLFPFLFICAFGFVAAILLRVWGRNGRPPSFETKKPVARPALSGVAKTLTWVALLELGLAGAFAFAGPGGWLTSGILGTVGVGLLIAARSINSKAQKTDRILQSGTPAEAQIVEIARTGTTLNDQPLLKLTLHIYQGGEDPIYPVVHKEFIPLGYMNRIQVGDRLPVKIDPLDSASLVVEWDKVLDPAT
jgi:hypothetical protein